MSAPVDEEKVYELACAILVGSHMKEFEQIQARMRQVLAMQADRAAKS